MRAPSTLNVRFRCVSGSGLLTHNVALQKRDEAANDGAGRGSKAVDKSRAGKSIGDKSAAAQVGTSKVYRSTSAGTPSVSSTLKDQPRRCRSPRSASPSAMSQGRRTPSPRAARPAASPRRHFASGSRSPSPSAPMPSMSPRTRLAASPRSRSPSATRKGVAKIDDKADRDEKVCRAKSTSPRGGRVRRAPSIAERQNVRSRSTTT